MRLALSGSTGLVGSALASALAAEHAIVPIARTAGSTPRADAIAWDGRERFDESALRACDAIIHLAGAGIADHRWSAARRKEIRDSRVIGTGAIGRLLAADPGRVRTLIVASGAGFYGDRGEAEVDERSPCGDGFLAAVCRDWEAAADPCRDTVRVVHLRLGVVLDRRGGALAKLLTPARFGLAGALGSGRQWWPWIGRSDLVAIVRHALADATLSGAFNAVAPQPSRQVELARAVAAAVGRWALAPPAPVWALRLALGGVVDEVLLASTRALPGRLVQAGFTWSTPTLAEALQAELATG
jgi:uncharacterized protein (TIGR01777 family)